MLLKIEESVWICKVVNGVDAIKGLSMFEVNHAQHKIYYTQSCKEVTSFNYLLTVHSNLNRPFGLYEYYIYFSSIKICSKSLG